MDERLKQLIQQSPFRNAAINAHIKTIIKNPICGDVIELSATINNEMVSALSFSGQGCLLSQAAMNIVAHKAVNTSLDAILCITPEQVFEDLALTVGPNRRQCITIALQSITDLVIRYRNDRAEQN